MYCGARILGQTLRAEFRDKSGFSGAGIARQKETAFSLFFYVRVDELLDSRK
jgi:hypothetical protein